ncbi:1,4-dihydroxy-2-naphthoate phytyltransferase [Thalassoporum mexicanum PCC 7367]|uniref:2-carboxy-1,4-naphthoquinone phytyltransferase n=1 Tax=Thalassoporum mexicanum TaxID=3457544 RepID=UPI00029FEB46|nr:2-carboxy-1,4-naphthoquinone phytyltransferase [Pseudanabaena sp. PCC 7367]AFY70036.1 1,4-dihydroxy-2-naphthoate phytyltransferase [Pseudanabaena sp. PCC 7367]
MQPGMEANRSQIDQPQSLSANSTPKSQRKLWLAAIKPPMYSVAIMPIVVGTAIAFYQTQQLNWRNFLTFMFAAILVLAWENLSNDVFDSETGIDQNKAHSVVNLTGNKNLVFAIANLFLLLGISGVVAISWWQRDFVVLGIVVLTCLLGYSYQGPPLRLGYLGWGEPICFICFGPLAIMAAYYSQTNAFLINSINSSAQNLAALAAAAIIVGVGVTLVLFCSHFHQVEDDIKAGKRSPVVRLGSKRAAQLIPWAAVSIYATTIVSMISGFLPLWSGLVLLSAPFAWKLSSLLGKYHDQPAMITESKYVAVLLQFSSGLGLSVGLVIARLLN